MFFDKGHQLRDEVIERAVGHFVLVISLHCNGEMHDTRIQFWGIEIRFLVHRPGGPFRFLIQSRDFADGKGPVESIGPAFRKIDVMSDAPGDANIFNVAILMLFSTAH